MARRPTALIAEDEAVARESLREYLAAICSSAAATGGSAASRLIMMHPVKGSCTVAANRRTVLGSRFPNSGQYHPWERLASCQCV
jgi:hypothetical protein